MDTIELRTNGGIANNKLPVLIYRKAKSVPYQKEFEKALKQHSWEGIWVNGVYNYHHYHSVSHEFLGVIAGTATLVLGGPGGKEINVEPGDALVLPAGTGHCLKSASNDFKILGAYPAGQEDYDICTENDSVEDKLKHIANVALPKADPIHGKGGGLMEVWKN